MKLRPFVSATSIALLLSGALLSGCATTAPVGRCDTAQSVGSCAVTVQQQGSRLVVCPVKDPAASPVCMNASVDVKRPGQKLQSTQVMLEPGRCVPLSPGVTSVTPSSCEAFAVRTSAAPAPVTASAP
ncbi:MAG: hypothetical protein ABI885_12845 [Gammaproteobacteria bacterium]